MIFFFWYDTKCAENKAKMGKWDCTGLYIGEEISISMECQLEDGGKGWQNIHPIRNYYPYIGNVCNSEAKTKSNTKW